MMDTEGYLDSVYSNEITENYRIELATRTHQSEHITL